MNILILQGSPRRMGCDLSRALHLRHAGPPYVSLDHSRRHDMGHNHVDVRSLHEPLHLQDLRRQFDRHLHLHARQSPLQIFYSTVAPPRRRRPGYTNGKRRRRIRLYGMATTSSFRRSSSPMARSSRSSISGARTTPARSRARAE